MINSTEFDRLIIDAVLSVVGAETVYRLGLDEKLSKQLTFTQDVLMSKLFFAAGERLDDTIEYNI